jgi:large subunit ribosomal protein L21
MKTKIGALVATVAAAVSAAGATVWARRKRDGKADAKRAKATKAKSATPGAGAATAGAGATKAGAEKAGATKAGATAGAGAASGAPATAGASEDTPRAAEADVAADAVADDLTSIKGLGARSAERLAEAGVTTLAQIAAWSEADIDEMAPRINVGAERIRREDWVGQARAATKG